jgi:two-component system invasion response regulator UvrY
MTPTILLADDHVMIAKGLKRLLEFDFGYREVESVTSCNALMRSLQQRTFTHLVTEIGLADGSALDILPTIRNQYPGTKVMVYSGKPSAIYERGLQPFGIAHYLSKGADEQETVKRFRYFLGDLSGSRPQGKTAEESPFACLTVRQLEVMQFLLSGKTGNEIADALYVKSNTISTIKAQIFERTGTRNMMELRELASLYSLFSREDLQQVS